MDTVIAIIMWLIIFLSVLLTAKACKIQIYDPPEEGKESSIFKINNKGLAFLAMYIIDAFHYEESGETLYSLYDGIIFSLGSILATIVMFYIIYGVMSLLKVSGEDTEDRRIKSFWLMFALSVVSGLVMLLDKI